MVEDILSLEQDVVEENEVGDEEEKSVSAGIKEEPPVEEIGRGDVSSSMVRGGTMVSRGMKGGDVLVGVPHAKDKTWKQGPVNKPRYKAPGDKYRKTVRREQPPEQQAE